MDIPEKTDATSSLLRFDFELSIPAPGEEVYCHWFLSALHRGRSGYRQSAIITVRAVSRQAGRMGAERRTGGRPFHPVDSNDRDRSPANHVWLGWNEYHIHASERACERATYCSRNSHRDCSRTTHRFQSWLRERPFAFVQSSEIEASLIAQLQLRANLDKIVAELIRGWSPS